LAEGRVFARDGQPFVVLLCAMAAMNALSVEIILPAIVPISRDFSISEETAAMLIGGYFLAYAFGQLFWGLMSDAFGRRPILLIGLAGYLLASVGCALATNFSLLLVARVLQGVLGAAPIVAYAIVRDVSSGTRAARMQAAMSAVITIAPLIVPVLGSGFLVLASWHWIFVILAAVSAVLWGVVMARLPETITERRPARLKPAFVTGRIASLFSDAQFRSGALVMSLTFSGFAAFLTLGSVVADKVYQVPPEAFGPVYMIASLATLAGVMLVRWLLQVMSLRRVGTLALGSLAVALAALAGMLGFEPSFQLYWAVLSLYLFAFGMVFPIFTSYALEASGSTPGFAASLIGALNMLGGFLSSLVVTSLYDGTFRAIPEVMLLMGGLAILVFLHDRLRGFLRSRRPG